MVQQKKITVRTCHVGLYHIQVQAYFKSRIENKMREDSQYFSQGKFSPGD